MSVRRNGLRRSRQSGKRIPTLIGRRVLLGSLVILGALAVGASPASGETIRLGIFPDDCVQVVVDGTPSGSSWSISASRAMLGVASNLFGIYYGPTMGSQHAGTTGSTPDNTFSACNICPGGTLDITFMVAGSLVPSSTLGFPNPSYFPSSDLGNLATYESQCGVSAAFDLGGFEDLDLAVEMLRPIFGPVMILIVVFVIIIVLPPVRGVPASRTAASPGQPFESQEVTRGSYVAETAPSSTTGPDASTIEGGGESLGGEGVQEGPPDEAPPRNPPP